MSIIETNESEQSDSLTLGRAKERKSKKVESMANLLTKFKVHSIVSDDLESEKI